jgi:hypothetical protein
LRRRPQLLVALLLGLGIVVSAGLSWIRSRLEAPLDVTAVLPREGLLFSVAGIDLPVRLGELRAFPLYRELFDPSARYVLSRFAGWERELPDPWSRLPHEGPATLGFYHGGWILAERSGVPAGTGVPDAVRGEWRFVASSPALLDRAANDPSAGVQAVAAGSVHIAVDPRSVTRARGRVGALVQGILPDHAEGDVRVDRAALRETWVLSCAAGCLLDALDLSSNAGTDGVAWSTVSPGAAAVSTFRFAPSAIRSFGRNRPGGSLKGLERIESFLDLAVRDDLAESLRGSGVAFVHCDASGKPRFTVALDLAGVGGSGKQRAEGLRIGIAAVFIPAGDVCAEPQARAERRLVHQQAVVVEPDSGAGVEIPDSPRVLNKRRLRPARRSARKVKVR